MPQVEAYRKALLEFYQARRDQEVQQDVEAAEKIKRVQNEKAAASATAAILPPSSTTTTTANTINTDNTSNQPTNPQSSLPKTLSTPSLSSSLASLTLTPPSPPNLLAKFGKPAQASHTEYQILLKPKSQKFIMLEDKQISKSIEFERKEMLK